jgi:hypothetical protein
MGYGGWDMSAALLSLTQIAVPVAVPSAIASSAVVQVSRSPALDQWLAEILNNWRMQDGL